MTEGGKEVERIHAAMCPTEESLSRVPEQLGVGNLGTGSDLKVQYVAPQKNGVEDKCLGISYSILLMGCSPLPLDVSEIKFCPSPSLIRSVFTGMVPRS